MISPFHLVSLGSQDVVSFVQSVALITSWLSVVLVMKFHVVFVLLVRSDGETNVVTPIFVVSVKLLFPQFSFELLLNACTFQM